MSILRHIQFCGELVSAVFHAGREKYYALALRHIAPDHPDAWLLTRRMLASRLRVNDFLSRISQ